MTHLLSTLVSISELPSNLDPEDEYWTSQILIAQFLFCFLAFAVRFSESLTSKKRIRNTTPDVKFV